MKKITIYECNDGTRFDSEEQALGYDVLLSKCNSINDVIGRKVELEYNQYVQRKSMTDEGKNQMPIIWALKPMKARQAEANQQAEADPDDDLPF